MKLRFGIGTALAFVVCICCTLVFGVTRAKADTDSGLGGRNAINLTVGENGPDITNAKATIYTIASKVFDEATGAYVYDFAEAFTDLSVIYGVGTVTAETWQKMTDEARAIINTSSVQGKEVVADGTITGIPDGIYLLSVADVTTDTDTYRFIPALVVAPTEVDAQGNTVPVNVMMKYEIAGRYGSLKISKTVTDFSGEAATFVYHIVDTETGGKKYENYAAVQYTAQGVQSTTVGHIPAGMKLTVTEVYTGARYQLASVNDVTVTIAPDVDNNVSFENEPSNTGTQGHGIENHFVYDENTNGGDWVLTPRVIDASEDITKYPDAA